MSAPLLSVKELEVSFERSLGWGKGVQRTEAVRGVSFDMAAGEIFGLVGESGCGKTTVSRSIVGLQPYQAGEIRFQGRPMVRGMQPRQVQMVFQDPYASLNPRFTVQETLLEPLVVHSKLTREERRTRVLNILDRSGLSQAALQKYPHEFSGGQRQRIAIARALVLEPLLLIADEPVSALDVSVQAMILNVLLDLRRDLGLAILFITHDLSVVKHMAERIGVMQRGRLVELGETQQVMEAPHHSYTQELLSAAPMLPVGEMEDKHV